MATQITLEQPYQAISGALPLSRVEDVCALPLFDGVERPIVKKLVRDFKARRYAPGTVLMRQGDDVPNVQILKSGILELTKANGAHVFGVFFLSSRDLVMPAAAIFQEPTLVTVRALTKATILEVDAQTLRFALDQSTRLSRNVMKAMSGQWRMAVRSVLDLSCRTAPQRLGAFLLRLADLQQKSTVPVLPIPKRNLAARLGITPETLSRTLQTVADHGLHLRGRTIIVHDRAGIEEFCGPDLYPARDERPLNVFAI